MRNPNRETIFRFKQFEMSNCQSAMKIGTDGVLLGAWSFSEMPESGCHKILDVGCGTGLIMLMMAQRFCNSKVTGVEIEHNAACEAKTNCANSKWGNRLNVVECDFKDFVESDSNAEASACFDMVISNPPFFSNGALAPDLSRNAARHEGWLNIENLIASSATLLKPGGSLAMIVPLEHRARIELQAALSGFCIHRQCVVRATEQKAPRRIMCELRKQGVSADVSLPQNEELTINVNGQPAPQYISLVKEFYTKIS